MKKIYVPDLGLIRSQVLNILFEGEEGLGIRQNFQLKVQDSLMQSYFRTYSVPEKILITDQLHENNYREVTTAMHKNKIDPPT